MNSSQTHTGRVESAAYALRRQRSRLDDLMRERGVSERSALLESFRRGDGTLEESETFHEAAATLAAVEQLEQATGG